MPPPQPTPLLPAGPCGDGSGRRGARGRFERRDGLGESWHLSRVAQQQAELAPALHRPSLMMEAEDGAAHAAHSRAVRELWTQGAYALPRAELRARLVAQFFAVVHPSYPVLAKAAFLDSLRSNSFSYQLVQAVLAVAAAHCDWAMLQRAGFVSRREAVEAFYRRARALHDGDAEPDKLAQIQTMFLMQFWWRAAADHRDPLWWLAGAVRMAQAMGLHRRSAARSRLRPADQRLWRRIWWLLFVWPPLLFLALPPLLLALHRAISIRCTRHGITCDHPLHCGSIASGAVARVTRGHSLPPPTCSNDIHQRALADSGSCAIDRPPPTRAGR